MGFSEKNTPHRNYGYRYYNPSTGRWPSRDPIEEDGGLNLYACVKNNPITKWDKLGLYLPPDWPPDDNIPLSYYEDRLRKNSKALHSALVSLCPSESASFVSNGKKQCCSKSSCETQAEALTTEMTQKAMTALRAQYNRFGNILQANPIEGAIAVNNRAYKAPNHGESASDYDKGYGLKCEGWTDLMVNAFTSTMTKYYTSGKLCFRAAHLMSDPGWLGMSLHNWVGLYGPNKGNIQSNWRSVDIHIDPWQTGGAELIPASPKTPATLGNVYW